MANEFEIMLNNIYDEIEASSKKKEQLNFPEIALIKNGTNTIWKNIKEFIRLIKHGNSKLINIANHNKRTIKDFIDFHGLDIDKIYELPFEKNDPNYNHDQLAFQAVQGERFIGITRSIR
jgi:hypothetical protein